MPENRRATGEATRFKPEEIGDPGAHAKQAVSLIPENAYCSTISR
jgi:hypothetical protein